MNDIIAINFPDPRLYQIDDVTHCPICADVYDDPRSLPCLHTYCLKCIETWATGHLDHADGTSTCPTCRRPFVMPTGPSGMHQLPSNFLMKFLLELRPRPCDELDRSPEPDALAENRPNACSRHAGKELALYCLDCDAIVCDECRSASHGHHRFSGIDQVINDFRIELLEKTNVLTDEICDCNRVIAILSQRKSQLVDRIAAAEADVVDAAVRRMVTVESDRQKLVDQLTVVKAEGLQCIHDLQADVDEKKTKAESFMQCLMDARNVNVAAGQLVDCRRKLRERFRELCSKDEIQQRLDRTCEVRVRFEAAARDESAGNVVGKLSVERSHVVVLSRKPTVKHVFPVRSRVGGITSIGDEMFVVRYNCKYVEVFDVVRSFELIRTLSVPNLGTWPLGVASCPADRYIYVSDYYSNALHRVRADLVQTKAVTTKWSVASCPIGVSVTSRRYVLVVCSGDGRIQEYSPNGFLVRDVCVDRDNLNGPWQAVQLDDKRYVVCQQRGDCRTRNRVCVVGRDTGRIERHFGGSDDAADKIASRRLSCPSGLAVDRRGWIVVADRYNGRIVIVNPALNGAEELIPSGVAGLKQPHAIHLDADRDRLYVADYSVNRIVLFNDVVRIGSGSGSSSSGGSVHGN